MTHPAIDHAAVDAAVVRHIATYSGFTEFVAACRGTYRPTLRADLMGQPDRDLIADAFDTFMQAAGDPRRAFRC